MSTEAPFLENRRDRTLVRKMLTWVMGLVATGLVTATVWATRAWIDQAAELAAAAQVAPIQAQMTLSQQRLEALQNVVTTHHQQLADHDRQLNELTRIAKETLATVNKIDGRMDQADRDREGNR